MLIVRDGVKYVFVIIFVFKYAYFVYLYLYLNNYSLNNLFSDVFVFVLECRIWCI